MWRWRDWVIDAFNRNLPFDQFTIEQLAGDLLPDATLDQQIATGFNRNHRGNAEGGIIPEEYAVEYVVDRVETTATVWLGLTLGCARCHDHKFDPITQQEFYQLFAFFNNVPENGRAVKYGNSPPYDQGADPRPAASSSRALDGSDWPRPSERFEPAAESPPSRTGSRRRERAGRLGSRRSLVARRWTARHWTRRRRSRLAIDGSRFTPVRSARRPRSTARASSTPATSATSASSTSSRSRAWI